MRAIRRVLPWVTCGLPAAVLADPLVGEWVRAHGVTVHACGDSDLDLLWRCGVQPAQVVFRCGLTSASIQGALCSGVNRFVVATERQADVLAGCATRAASVHLDAAAVAVSEHERLDVIGIHCDVDTSRPGEWGAATEQLMSRIALLRADGPALMRISLVGGSAAAWFEGDKVGLRAIAAAVDDAIDDGCARWRLPRPAVSLAPSTV